MDNADGVIPTRNILTIFTRHKYVELLSSFKYNSVFFLIIIYRNIFYNGRRRGAHFRSFNFKELIELRKNMCDRVHVVCEI